MKFLRRGKDGGPESTVWGYWLFEVKWLCSVVLLRFEDGSRDAYHDHAFNAVSWVLSGALFEAHKNTYQEWHTPSWWPVFTRRETFHRVRSHGRSWVLQFRGPGSSTWREYLPATGETVTLTHGRLEASFRGSRL